MIKTRVFISVFLVCLAVMSLPSYADDTGLVCHGGILISREIKPYMQMVESFENTFNLRLCRAFLDPDGQIKSLDFPVSHLDRSDWPFFVAVGPDALSYLAERQLDTQVFYAMVLDPERIAGTSDTFCGVTLNLFTSERIRRIKDIFPDLERPAVIYNPDSNLIIQDVLAQFDLVPGLNPVPVAVTSRNSISRALEQVAKQAGAIYFIPDRTVISPAVIKHIISYGIARSIPSIGYNRFFHESGAVLSFDVDYEAVGRRMADMVSLFREQGVCGSRDPEAVILYNEKVATLLKMEVQKQFLTR